MKKDALHYLNLDRLQHINMLESINHNRAEILKAGKSGVLIYDKPSQTIMVSAIDLAAYQQLLADVPQIRACVIYQGWAKEFMEKRFSLIPEAAYYQAAYFKSEYPIHTPSKLRVRQLKKKDIPLVQKHYMDSDDHKYMMSRVLDNALFAGFSEDNVIGFIGIHDEGSIGLIEVLRPYRRQGYGLELLNFMIAYYLQNNDVPYSQISTANVPSIRLHQKAGMVLSKKPVIWMLES